uniref:Astrotactin 2 n=1 Tax=Oncorhynchus mykiss TaxID=8022 RepID=A0A8K9XDW1_ONCMY
MAGTVKHHVLLLMGLLLTGTATVRGSRGGAMLDEEREKENDAESPCEVKTVTVSTLPVLRENEFSFTGGGSGSVAGGGGESRLLLFVRTDLPGRISVMDDLDNTALPYFTLEMSGLGADISQVHWKQQWLENGTLYFHVSMSTSEQLIQTTVPTAQEPAHVLHEHMHLLHISVMGGLIALLLLILLFTLVLYTRHRWCKRRRIPQKSASTEATHEIHYIPSVLLGPQGRDSFRGSRQLQHSSVIGMPIRETPILDDYDCDEDDQMGHTHTSTPNQVHNQLIDGKTVEALMQRFKESFRPNTTMEIAHFQHVTHSSSTGRKRGPSHTRVAGSVFGRQGDSGSEGDDETQLKFYTEQHRGRRRSRGCPHSPMNKATLTLITISTCVLAVVYGTQLSCSLTVKVTLHVPEHFVADGSSFVVSMGSFLDVSNWLNPAKLILYYQTNSSTQWVRDYCGQRTTEPCEQLCDPETEAHTHTFLFSLNLSLILTPNPKPNGLWLPVSKSFVVPPVELSINPIASCKTDVLVTEDPGDVREEAIMSTYFDTVDDLLASFGPVRDCSQDNGGCRKNFKCVSDRRVDSTGCMCPDGLRPMKDGSGCYDYSKGTDCTDGFNGGCEQLCLQQLVPLLDNPSSSNILMFCGCVQEYKLGADGRSCLLQTENCEGPKCQRQDIRFNDTLFGEMLHGYNNKSQQVNLGQVFQMTFRDNNFIKDFPQLADGLMVIPLPVEEQCRGVLSEPLSNVQLLTGVCLCFNEAMGYPMVQQWRVRSNLYKVKLSAITLSTGFSKVLKTLTAESSREELLSFIQQYGSHYVSEALYGSELSCTIYFPSKKAQQQLWLQYQKEVTDQGSRRELKSMPFISYLSGLLKTQLLAEDLVSGVEIRCEEKGSCPSACHLCHQAGREQPLPIPVLLEVSRIVPLYSLVQDNVTKESATMSSYWCTGKGDVIDNWCRCDLSAFSKDGLPNCSPLRKPVLRLAPHLEPSSTMVALEWLDVEPLIGYKVSDYIIQHKRVEDPSEVLLVMVILGLLAHLHLIYLSHVHLCLSNECLSNECLPNDFHVSPLPPPPVSEIADKVYNLYNGYTSGKEQQTAYNTLMEIPPPLLYRVQHHYNSHYEKFGDFVWRSEDELGPRKAHLILRRVERISRYCRALLHSAYIQSRTDTMAYVFCRSEEVRPTSKVWHGSLHETRTTCMEKLISVQRSTYGNAKLR